MGTTFTHLPYRTTPKKYFDARFTNTFDGVAYRVLKSAVFPNVDCKVYYAAVESTYANGISYVSARVVKFKLDKNNEISYDMFTDASHPYFYKCPESILKLLTETTDTYALSWRDKCWSRVNRIKFLKSQDTVKVKFNTVVPFRGFTVNMGDVLILNKYKNCFAYRLFGINYKFSIENILHSCDIIQ